MTSRRIPYVTIRHFDVAQHRRSNMDASSKGKRVAFNGADRSVYDGPFEETTRASGFERSEIQLRRSTGRSDAQLDARSERDRNLCHAALNCRLVHAHCCSLFEKHFKAISVVRLNEFRKYDSLLL